MILHRIVLKNFRQFYGEQVIDIARDPKKNITLVHAENGVGKTTLLNAVLWTLFGFTTKKFEQREKILNFAADEEGATTSSVELTFEHEGERFLAIRTHHVTQGGQQRGRFDVMKFTGRNGSLSSPLPNPNAFVNTVVPLAMAPYFFFDGEQAETFSSEDNYKNVAAAIRDILGCTIIETAVEDLDYVSRTFGKALKDLPGQEELSKLEGQIETLQEESDEHKKQVTQLTGNIESAERQYAEIMEELRNARGAAELQALRDSKDRDLSAANLAITEARSEVLRWISTKALSVISTKAISVSLDFIDEASLRGKIPSPYNEDFVKGLLAAERCVCDRPLAPRTPEWNAVQGLLRNAANAELLGKVVRARSRIEVLRESRADAPRLLEDCERRLAASLEKRRTLERELEDISKRLEAHPVAEIQQRERAARELRKTIDRDKERRTRLDVEIETSDRTQKRLREDMTTLSKKSEKAQKVIVRRDMADQLKEALKSLLSSYEQGAREDIQAAVNQILAVTARRHYQMKIDESFELKLYFSDGRPAPKSSGENQLMSLAFIASLVQFAEKRSKEKAHELLIPATVAPLVLDSPFGQLDDKYREATAQFVPEMAPQVVLLVSSSQGKSEVVAALGDRIGQEYVLITENKDSKGEKKQDFITINGQRMATTRFNCERNMTRIEKVS